MGSNVPVLLYAIANIAFITARIIASLDFIFAVQITIGLWLACVFRVMDARRRLLSSKES